VALVSCRGATTAAVPPPTSSFPFPSLPPGFPSSYPQDLPAGDVPPDALVPTRTEITGTWFAHTAVGDAIVVAWQLPGSDPFRTDRGLAVWRHTGDPGAPWRPVYTVTYPATKEPVLGLTTLVGDVTGDGSDDALVFAQTGGSGGCGTYLVIDVASGERVFDRAVCDTRIDPSTDPVGLVMTEAVYASGDPHCCPSSMKTSVLIYTKDGTWSTTSETTAPA